MTHTLNILAVFPHPDDSVIYAGASLNKWVREGHKVSAICCTDGEVGTLRTDLSKEDVSRLRKNELMAACKIIGITDIEMLHYPDAGVMDPKGLRKDLIRCMRKYKPDRVLSMDPWAPYEIHPDHRMVGQMSAEAAAFAGFPLLYTEQLNQEIHPHTASEVWFMGLLGHRPNCFVDVSTSIDKKVEALLQFETTLSIITELLGLEIHMDTISTKTSQDIIHQANEWIRTDAEKIGKHAGLTAAEAFYVLKCLPGHFDNLQRATKEVFGDPDEAPMIC